MTSSNIIQPNANVSYYYQGLLPGFRRSCLKTIHGLYFYEFLLLYSKFFLLRKVTISIDDNIYRSEYIDFCIFVKGSDIRQLSSQNTTYVFYNFNT